MLEHFEYDALKYRLNPDVQSRLMTSCVPRLKLTIRSRNYLLVLLHTSNFASEHTVTNKTNKEFDVTRTK